VGALFLSEDDVRALVGVEDAIEALEGAFLELAAGRADDLPRRRARGPGAVLHLMGAALPSVGRLGLKAYATTRAGASFHVSLYDARTAELVALIEADWLGRLRTGAASAVAARRLAPEGASTLGLFGTGRQAATQLAALAAVRPLARVTVWSRDEARRRRFAEEAAAAHGLAVVAARAPEEAARGQDLVATATTSREPVVRAEWIGEATLVCAVGSNAPERVELEPELVGRASLVVCDSRAACEAEKGELALAAERGLFAWERAGELAALVAGRLARPARGPWIFASVGLALEDVALAALVVERARRAGRGRALERAQPG
jgi:ornithine cyclodeaminase/alanine dehydrogenase